MDGMEELVGEQVVIFYDDAEKVMRKSGKLLAMSPYFVTIETEGHREAIAVKSIIRLLEEARP